MYFVLLWSMVLFFKQKTAYEMRISDWSSDVCSSDLALDRVVHVPGPVIRRVVAKACCDAALRRDGMAARREDLCDAGCSQALFGAAHGGAQARSTGADNNGVIDVIDDLVGGGHQAGAPVNAILRTAKIASAADRKSTSLNSSQ